MPMKNPAHPGRIIKNACLEPLGLSVTRAANGPGVSRNSLSRVIHGHAAVSPEMAIRLGKVGWSTAGAWLRLQTAYDLAQARKKRGKDQCQEIRSDRHRPTIEGRIGLLALRRRQR